MKFIETKPDAVKEFFGVEYQEPTLSSNLQRIKNEIAAIEQRGEWWNGNLEDLANEQDAHRHDFLLKQLEKLEATLDDSNAT